MEQPTQPNPQELPERVSLPTVTVNEILSTFSGMPYREVANLIAKIQKEVTPVLDGPTPPPVTQDKPAE